MLMLSCFWFAFRRDRMRLCEMMKRNSLACSDASPCHNLSNAIAGPCEGGRRKQKTTAEIQKRVHLHTLPDSFSSVPPPRQFLANLMYYRLAHRPIPVHQALIEPSAALSHHSARAVRSNLPTLNVPPAPSIHFFAKARR